MLATRYVVPLREGGSLPGLVEADDLGTYVVKFRGAGQGVKSLIAEVIVGELARRLRLRVPDLKIVELDAAIARYEADQEVQDLLNVSHGANLGVDFLPGALGYDGASCKIAPDEAATILWLDAFVANVDRSWQNPNLLVWHRQLWCIDHGAALYFHHSWPVDPQPKESEIVRFAQQKYDFDKHILSDHRRDVHDVDARLVAEISSETLASVVAQVPDEWLIPPGGSIEPDDVRALYVDYLLARARSPRAWLPASEDRS